jgi:O-antigen/teichoic acid export membrane protein
VRRTNGRFQEQAHAKDSDSGKAAVASKDTFKARQEAGLSALLRVVADVSLTVSEAETVAFPLYAPAVPDPGQRASLARFKTDHLLRGSLYLMFSFGIQAILGFVFWIVMARIYNPADVGRASSLISATNLIGYSSLFGLNSTLIRFLPSVRDRNSLITSALAMVAGTAAIIGLAYILLTPVIAPRLAFVEHNFALTVGFVVLAAAAAVNLLTDSVFIASRKANLCALTDGIVGGVTKIVFGVLFGGAGAYGLYCASVGGLAAAALVSVVLIVVILRWRPSFRNPIEALRPVLKFSGANYVANSFILLPNVMVPLIALDRLGAQESGYYFVAYQMASLLFNAVYAVEQSFMAEGSKPGADWRAIRRSSRRLATLLFVPGCAVLLLTANWILLAFGAKYRAHSVASLDLLAVTVIPLAVCNWSWTVLRLLGRLRVLVLSTAVYACAICGSAWILAPHGLAALTVGWPIGCALAAVVATVGTVTNSVPPASGHGVASVV